MIMLKKNKETVLQKLRGCVDCPAVAFGEILGYPYIGPDWAAHMQDTYTFTYYAVDSLTRRYPLYTFNIPMCKYEPAVREKVISNGRAHESVLAKYGFSLTTRVALTPKGRPDLITELPTVPTC